jgi:hypothetical protein
MKYLIKIRIDYCWLSIALSNWRKSINWKEYIIIIYLFGETFINTWSIPTLIHVLHTIEVPRWNIHGRLRRYTTVYGFRNGRSGLISLLGWIISYVVTYILYWLTSFQTISSLSPNYFVYLLLCYPIGLPSKLITISLGLRSAARYTVKTEIP